ncbi:nicotinamide riboside kinase 1 isoform X2 [Dermatophagoides farinae]|uniref:nicotinamide riboside kinase 1 isoform X2 n=1 Tax=Dermatophagoides farinae TaxID=6954 RepID=UPI001F0D63FC|nr:nicotinamide riboside kinase 1-like isoform X2 [Dermatophagoides farinae]
MCTNCGKTTLCEKLCNRYPSSSAIINQDTYFREEDDPNHVWVPLCESRKHQNWELLECINWNDMCMAIYDIISKPAIVRPSLLLIDGHIIFNYQPLANVFDRKYFIRTYDKLMIHKRRLKRDYIPPDPAGYFDQYVWPMYLKNLEKISNQKDIKYIDGSMSMEHIYQQVCNDLDQFLLNISRKN